MTDITPTTDTKKPTLNDQAYDVLKFIALIVLPALVVLYVALAALWDLPKPTEVAGTITAVDLFLGGLLGVSTSNYKKTEADKDGVMVVNTSDPDKDQYSLEINTPLAEIEKKNLLTLKVRNDS